METNQNYTAYHIHTDRSLLDSCTLYKDYIDKAVELGQKAIAFTEHGNIYNYIEKKMYANSKGLKYIHGAEFYLTASLKEKVRDNYHTILLAKNYEGVKEINLLIQLSTQPDHFYYKPRITFDEFFNISDNVIKISACLASPLSKYPKDIESNMAKLKQELLEKRDSDINALNELSKDQKAEQDWIESIPEEIRTHEEWMSHCVDNFRRLQIRYDEEVKNIDATMALNKQLYHKLLQSYDYYEIQPHVKSLEQIQYNKMLYEASKKYNIPLIAGTDTHSLNEYKAKCRSILQKAKHIEFSNEDEFDLTYKSYDELVEMFRQQGSLPMEVVLEAIENTNRMADSVEDYILDTSVKYPKLYDNEEEVLKKRIVKKLKDKLEKGIIDKKDLQKYKDNITEEMRVFKKINMVGFMLFMSELVCWCWEHNIPIGYCRGSVGGSTIAYITDIIDVDPVKWNTVFSRFANESREEVGDIDIDIAPDQRDLVYEHIITSFGLDKTAYILAIGTISDKGTIDEIGRALNIPLDEVAQIKNEYDVDPEKTKAKYPDLFYYFDGLNGTAVSQSFHPAGIVVSPITLPDNYGVFWNDGKEIMCINMEEIHDGAGLVKYDLLALKSLMVIRKTCEYANIPYPKSHELNWNDEKVWEDMITCKAGIFQFESDYGFEMIKQYRPKCVDDLSLINASLRPSGASYRDRLLAGEINKNPSELIDKLLESSHCFLVYQEQTIQFLQNICGLSGSEADNIRRAIGRKQVDRLQAAMPSILEGYCKMSPQPREIAEEEAKTFLKIIEDSSSYQFGFNHSTGYSMVGYTCAYMRYYYPEEFIAAYLNCASNQDDIIFGTEIANVKNIIINPIKFGYSRADYTVDKKNHALYKGLESIKFLNSQIADELFELSKNKYTDFISLLKDISEKTSVNSRQLTILIVLGFFQDFGNNQYLLDLQRLFFGEKDSKGKIVFPALSTVKQIKKDQMEKFGISDFLMKKYSLKETEKIFKEIDSMGLLREMASGLENRSLSVIEQIKAEIEYLNYCVYKNPKVHESYYVVISYETGKNPSLPRLTLHNVKTGEDIKTRIKKTTVYKANPFGLYSVLKIKELTPTFKTKLINGEWQKTDEVEDVLEQYEVIKND